ncbi:energy transducer TonB [Botryobacter ruber]|uniref:energy transducer TonB n=1 Tax=Botryobacter ruber TaxID=2171629 RepID=UPI0013E2EDB6|nr:energy transducer TonB [Botryobacter ruber]
MRDDYSVKHGPYEMVGKPAWRVAGQYAASKPVGVWSYYRANGQLDMQFDFEENKYLKVSKGSSFCKKLKVLTENGFAEAPVDQQPFYITGDAGVFGIVAINIKYPRDAINAGISGVVNISAEITETGAIVNEKVEKGLYHSMDQEALRVVTLIPDEWVPARIDGKPVRTKIMIPIKFTIK